MLSQHNRKRSFLRKEAGHVRISHNTLPTLVPMPNWCTISPTQDGPVKNFPVPRVRAYHTHKTIKQARWDKSFIGMFEQALSLAGPHSDDVMHQLWGSEVDHSRHHLLDLPLTLRSIPSKRCIQERWKWLSLLLDFLGGTSRVDSAAISQLALATPTQATGNDPLPVSILLIPVFGQSVLWISHG